MKKEVEKEKPKKNTLVTIICIILGIFSLLGGLVSLLYAGYFRGILYLIVAIFAFLPQKITRVLPLIKLLIIFVVLAILYAAGQVSLIMISNNLIYHNMSEGFILDKGDLSMIIYNTTETTSILVGNQTKTTEGYFLFVNCGITNLKKDSITLSPTPTLTDNQNNTYQRIGFGGENEYFQHNLEKETYFLFEVPKTAQGFRFLLEDSTGVHVVKLDK